MRSVGRRLIARCAILPWLLIAVVPLLEKGGLSAESHVEAAGTATHVAHNHEDCLFCSSHRGFGPPPARPALPELRSAVEARGVHFHPIYQSARSSSSSPRAPPVLVLSFV